MAVVGISKNYEALNMTKVAAVKVDSYDYAYQDVSGELTRYLNYWANL
jgi:hypothetical protein